MAENPAAHHHRAPARLGHRPHLDDSIPRCSKHRYSASERGVLRMVAAESVPPDLEQFHQSTDATGLLDLQGIRELVDHRRARYLGTDLCSVARRVRLQPLLLPDARL